MSHIAVENISTGLSNAAIYEVITQTVDIKATKKVLLIPPDGTRAYSGAGQITAQYYSLLTNAGIHVDILPALGTHAPMTREQQVGFFGDIPADRFLEHNWRTGVTTLGEIPADYVKQASEGHASEAIPVQVSDYLVDPSYDRIISSGQVVPHEVAGMANFTKNIVIGCGGSKFISASHIVGAFYGAERIMGRVSTPVRKLFDYAEDNFLAKLPLTYVLTVTRLKGNNADILGLYAGSGPGARSAFIQAAALSQEINITHVEKPIQTCVVWLDEHEFHSTWLGNKAVYRTRMAMAKGGQLIVMAPAVKSFGEDAQNDKLIRKYGYIGREKIISLISTEECLRQNLSAAAHLIHGSSDGQFEITYAAPLLGKDAVEGVGYKYMELTDAMACYDPKKLTNGFNTLSTGQEIYFIPNPALGLWSL